MGDDPYNYDMGANGDRAGGVARPATAIRYWNRAIGQSESQRRQGRGQGNASPAAGAQASDVISFLNGLFSEKAKLLGLIGLREFVEKLIGVDEDALRKAMPQLVETADFIGSGLASVVGNLSAKITPVLEQAQNLGKSGPGHDLADSLEVLKRLLDNFPQHEPEKVPATLSQIWSVGQRALGAMEAIERAPVAAIGAFISGQLKGKLDALIKNQPQKVWQELPKQFGQLLKRAIDDNSKTPLARLIFPVPFLPGSDGTADPDVDAVMNAVDRAVAKVAWDTPDPLQQVLQQVAADPQLNAISQQKLQIFVAAVQDTPLYRRFAQLAAQASETADTVISEAAEDVVGLWEGASRIQAMLSEQASQICDSGFRLMKALTDAIAPNLAVCAKGAYFFPDPLCKQLDDTLKKLPDMETKIGDAINQSSSGTERITLQQFQSYVRDWSHFVTEFRDRSDEVATDLGKIRNSDYSMPSATDAFVSNRGR